MSDMVLYAEAFRAAVAAANGDAAAAEGEPSKDPKPNLRRTPSAQNAQGAAEELAAAEAKVPTCSCDEGRWFVGATVIGLKTRTTILSCLVGRYNAHFTQTSYGQNSVYLLI